MPASLLAGCAAGEPIESFERDFQLLEEKAPARISAEFMVEVTRQGRPVVAEHVFGWGGGQDTVDAYCMVHAGVDRCATWFVSFESPGPMTVFADLCGELYSQPFAFALQPSAESFTFQSHVTIEADTASCGRASPQQCGGDAFATAALEIETVDPSGNPVDVRGVRYEFDEDGSYAADCLEGYGRGCAEWASQHTKPGRYRATVDVCGDSFSTPWVTVEADDSGCKAIAEHVALVVDERGCDYSG